MVIVVSGKTGGEVGVDVKDLWNGKSNHRGFQWSKRSVLSDLGQIYGCN